MRANQFILVLAFCLLPIFSMAGGLAIAPMAAIVGIVGYAAFRPVSFEGVPLWFQGLCLFLGWAIITSFWSPYEDTQAFSNPFKLALGVLLYLGCIFALKIGRNYRPEFLRGLLTVTTFVLAVLLFIDLMTGYALSFFVDSPSPGESLDRKRGDAESNLGHGITVLTLLLPIVVVLMRRTRGYLGRTASLGLIGLTLACAALGNLSVGILAVVGGVLAMSAARARPALTIRCLTWLTILSIFAAPVIGYLMGYVPDNVKAAMPFSWEHRVEMWGYTAHRIFEVPLWGHGFDAVRTFDDTFSTRGIEAWAIVSLHPHNAGLHIWVETGVIGAVLAGLTVLAGGFALEEFSAKNRRQTMAAAGLISSALIISSTTYGLWQEWWWGTIILVATTILLIPEPEQL